MSAPRLLSTSGPRAAATAMPPIQQPTFMRNASSGFAIPAYYNSYPSRTELFSPLESAHYATSMNAVTWNANPLAASTPAAAPAAAPALGAEGVSASAAGSSSSQTYNNSSTRGWRSVSAAVNAQNSLNKQ